MRRRDRRHGRHEPEPPQLDLFRPRSPEPEWRHLPKDARATVTSLMVRLLREHRPHESRGATGGRHDDN
jgi:hypothetical protein